MKDMDPRPINEQLEQADDLKFSAVWVRENVGQAVMQEPWCVPGTRWSPDVHDRMKFKRLGIFTDVRGSDPRVTPLAMPSDTKGLFVIKRAIWRQRIKGGNEIPSTSFLHGDLARYYEAGLNPILIWDSHHPQFMTTAGMFPKQRWHTWLALYDRIAFMTEGEAVIAQTLNDLQAQERKSSGTEQGPAASASAGMAMGSGGGTTI